MTAPMVDYKIHWLKMMSVPQSRAVVGRHDGINGRDTHLSLGKDTPDGRPVQPAGSGTVVSLPKVGGLHHRYERLAA